MKELQLAKEIIVTFLEKNITPDGLYDVYEIKHGNKDILMQHLKALYGIFQKAIKQLEESDK